MHAIALREFLGCSPLLETGQVSGSYEAQCTPVSGHPMALRRSCKQKKEQRKRRPKQSTKAKNPLFFFTWNTELQEKPATCQLGEARLSGVGNPSPQIDLTPDLPSREEELLTSNNHRAMTTGETSCVQGQEPCCESYHPVHWNANGALAQDLLGNMANDWQTLDPSKVIKQRIDLKNVKVAQYFSFLMFKLPYTHPKEVILCYLKSNTTLELLKEKNCWFHFIFCTPHIFILSSHLCKTEHIWYF